MNRSVFMGSSRMVVAVRALVFAFAVWALCSAQEQAGVPLAEPVDIDVLKITWRNLSSEPVMFPMDMRDMAAKIGKERQLFIDNYFIAEADKITRQVRQPDRYEGNPVLVPPRSKFNQAVIQHVMQFKDGPRFRVWYTSWDDWQSLPTGQRIRFATSYATSEDGKNWMRPQLDLYNVEGLVHSGNVVLPYGLMQGLFHDTSEPDPEKRFKALVCVERKNPAVREGYYLHTSPDGIHWTGDLSQHVIPSLSRGYGIPQNGIGDTTRFWWDPIRRKYVGDVKFVVDPGKDRCRGVMESDDLIHWSRPIPTLYTRDSDTQVYGHRGFPYQGMYVGMRWIFLPGYSVRHSSHVELDCSRDGRIWTRVAAGQRFMDYNPRHDTWDATIMRPVSMLEVGDEIWIYYFGAPSELETKNPDYPKSQPVEWSLGLATLPRDRFVSLNGGAEAGTVTTRPLSFSGGTLHVNAQIEEGGALSVAVLDPKGRAVDGFGHDECLALRGDSLDLRVQWKGGADLARQAQSHVRFRFRLRNARLYSFWVSD